MYGEMEILSSDVRLVRAPQSPLHGSDISRYTLKLYLKVFRMNQHCLNVCFICINHACFRFVIGRRGCVVRDIESRCNVRVIFNTDDAGDFKSEDIREKGEKQMIKIRGYSLDQINDSKV